MQTQLPWSLKSLRKLGVWICDHPDENPPSTLPTYDDVMVFYNELAAATQAEIEGWDWAPLLGDRVREVTSRPKTIDTLREKLKRDHATPLQSVQDIAGVRFEAEMTLDEQDAVVEAIAGHFRRPDDPDSCRVRDMREEPHSGYRAVHLWLRLPARVEVQVRTHLQGQWANTYEALADIEGRRIRYGKFPEEKQSRVLVETLQKLSTEYIAPHEKALNETRLIRLLLEEMSPEDAATAEAEAARQRLAKIDARLSSEEQDIQLALANALEAFDNIRAKRKG